MLILSEREPNGEQFLFEALQRNPHLVQFAHDLSALRLSEDGKDNSWPMSAMELANAVEIKHVQSEGMQKLLGEIINDAAMRSYTINCRGLILFDG